jgi:hypothetical protein
LTSHDPNQKGPRVLNQPNSGTIGTAEAMQRLDGTRKDPPDTFPGIRMVWLTPFLNLEDFGGSKPGRLNHLPPRKPGNQPQRFFRISQWVDNLLALFNHLERFPGHFQ